MDPNVSTTTQYKCQQCGANLAYTPGTTELTCAYCGAKNAIAAPAGPEEIEDSDFEAALAEPAAGSDETEQIHTVKCKGCGAETTLRPNVAADTCPFCDMALVVGAGETRTRIKPRYLLPFKIDAKAAGAAFRKWIGGLWFAPSRLKLYADNADRLSGVYIPCWTYDSSTTSRYIGERGEDYQEHYTVEVNGRTENRTRTKTRWYPAAGSVDYDFDDVLVIASASLPRDKAEALEPWDLPSLVPYDPAYLSGFRSETYQVDLKNGFERAKQIMDPTIRTEIQHDIGGDHQRIHSVQTRYDDITFKHVLLPMWISAFRFNEKVYRFVINARTGEVQGERPWSWVKITFAVLGVLVVIAVAVAVFSGE